MDSDEEFEILSYTPLKRQKIGVNGSIHTSQLSVSNSERKKSLRQKSITISQNLKTKTDKKGTGKLNLTSNINGTYVSQVSCKAGESSEIFKYPLNMGSNSKSNNRATGNHRPNNNNVVVNSNDTGAKKEVLNDRIESCHIDQCSPSSNVTKLFDEDIPDIDFTQLTNSTNKKCSSMNSVISVSSDSSESQISESLLNNTPPDVPQTPPLKEGSSTIGYNTNDNLSGSHIHLPSKNSKQIRESLNLRTQSPVNDNDKCLPNEKDNKRTCSISSDDDFEISGQADLGKVDSWLESSLGYLTPKKIEVVQTPAPAESDAQASSSKSNTGKSSDFHRNGMKACIHFHFHANSPQKSTQTTTDNYFKPTCTSSPVNAHHNNKMNAHHSNKKNSIKNMNEKQNTRISSGINNDNVLETWRTIMNSMKGLVSTSGVKDSVSQNVGSSSTPRLKKCPFYKFIEDTTFVVDAFSYGYIDGVSAYFLSHFHYDHYRGLHKNFNKAIYCSKITANLVRLKLRVQEKYLVCLPLENPVVIGGVEVTLYDANHCPGAVMFLFKLKTGKTMLHVGDFRAHSTMENINAFWNSSIDVLYLDTTYLDPRYDFHSQEDVIEKCVRIAQEHISNCNSTLFLVGSYTIGKEKVFKAISSELDCKIYAPIAKEKVLHCLEDQDIIRRLTKDKFEGRVHVVSMGDLSPIKLRKYIGTLQSKFKVLVAMRPTGWEYCESVSESLENITPKQIGNIFIYGIPYSEHSSYFELQRFVQFLQPKKIIPTVNNGSPEARKKMENILAKWKTEARQIFRKRKK